jgi:hypothetical protein
MSLFRKGKPKQQNAPDIRLARKLMGKDSGRKVWGFPCSPDIPARMKVLAGRLNVPIYALTEHALQLTAPLMSKMADNAEECESLRTHILEDHVERRTIEKISQFDENVAHTLEVERAQRFETEKVIRHIVVHFLRKGMKPEDIVSCIDYGLRYMAEAIHSKPQRGNSGPQVP